MWSNKNSRSHKTNGWTFFWGALLFSRARTQSLFHTWTVNESEWISKKRQKERKSQTWLYSVIWIYFCRQASGSAIHRKKILIRCIQPDIVTYTCTSMCACVCACLCHCLMILGTLVFVCVHTCNMIKRIRAIFPCEIFNQWCACRQIFCGYFSLTRTLWFVSSHSNQKYHHHHSHQYKQKRIHHHL